MSSRRRPSSPEPASAHPLEDEDLLQEILLRLPPQPSSLPRASLVCKRWERLVSDPGFFRRFRAHHRKPPLLGFFHYHRGIRNALFTPTLDSPDHIPETHFPFPESHDKRECTLEDCRHGLALFFNWLRREAVVWHPVTGRHSCVAFPPGFCPSDDQLSVVPIGAVMCAAGDDDGHVHGNCHFKLVLVRDDNDGACAACLYQSKSGAWGNIISTPTADEVSMYSTSVMVGNTVCWLLHKNSILQFVVESQSLVVIDMPADRHVTGNSYFQFQILRTADTGLGLTILTGLSLELWNRRTNSDGIVTWGLQKTVQLDKLLSLGSSMDRTKAYLRGYVEDRNAIIVLMYNSVFMVQLGSLQFKKLFETKITCRYCPYTSFYAAGRACGAGPETLNNAWYRPIRSADVRC